MQLALEHSRNKNRKVGQEWEQSGNKNPKVRQEWNKSPTGRQEWKLVGTRWEKERKNATSIGTQ